MRSTCTPLTGTPVLIDFPICWYFSSFPPSLWLGVGIYLLRDLRICRDSQSLKILNSSQFPISKNPSSDPTTDTTPTLRRRPDTPPRPPCTSTKPAKPCPTFQKRHAPPQWNRPWFQTGLPNRECLKILQPTQPPRLDSRPPFHLGDTPFHPPQPKNHWPAWPLVQ